ncbi:MAG TPA: hypothetical protein QGF58_13080 [Myxococcota bacterium]|nr:hypothetical protein [Myxococcota bacterium]
MTARRTTLLLLVASALLLLVAARRWNTLRWSWAEYDSKVASQSAWELMRVLDGDGDGHLDTEEWANLSSTPMAGWDQDGDGRVDADELRDAAWTTSPLQPDHRGQPDP